MIRCIWALRTWRRIQGSFPEATASTANVAAITVIDFIRCVLFFCRSPKRGFYSY